MTPAFLTYFQAIKGKQIRSKNQQIHAVKQTVIDGRIESNTATKA